VIRYQITDGTAHLDEARWLAALNPEADFIQIREPHLSTRDLSRLVRRVSSLSKVVVNDRADVAIACGAAGVHLRGDSVAPALIRSIAPEGFVISVACHSDEDVLRAEGADYAILAPIFKPLSKTDSRPPLGLPALRRIVNRASVPVIALGGITSENAAACIEAGAAGVAGITLLRRL
jgi:thiamine-phosphate pyrophosphorylase